jgi:hypothetical protein
VSPRLVTFAAEFRQLAADFLLPARHRQRPQAPQRPLLAFTEGNGAVMEALNRRSAERFWGTVAGLSAI